MKRILILAVFCFLTVAHADLTNGLIAYFPFAGNGNDASGHGNNADQNGTPTYSAFGQKMSVSLQPPSDYFVVPQSPSLNVASGQGFSVSVWVKPSSLTNSMPIVEWGDSQILGPHLWLYQGGKQILWTVGYLSTFPSGEVSISPVIAMVPTNDFTHIVGTYDAVTGRCCVYANGELVGALTNANSQFTTGTGFDMFIGHRPLSWANSDMFSGSLHDVRIYSRTLDPQEVKHVYASDGLRFSIETAAIRLRWVAVSNITYQIQYSSDFNIWSNISSIIGSGTETNFVDWTDGNRKFYRVSVAP